MAAANSPVPVPFERRVALARTCSRLAGMTAVLAGVAVLAEWFFDIARLKRISAGLADMKATPRSVSF